MALLLAPAIAFAAMNPLIEDVIQRPVRHEPIQSVYRPDVPTLSRQSIITLITDAAQKYHVNAFALAGTIICESNLNPNAIGDHGDSLGLAQINLPSHPEVTEAQATDPYFAIEFIANQFAEGRAYLWSCWRNKTWTN